MFRLVVISASDSATRSSRYWERHVVATVPRGALHQTSSSPFTTAISVSVPIRPAPGEARAVQPGDIAVAHHLPTVLTEPCLLAVQTDNPRAHIPQSRDQHVMQLEPDGRMG
jgi:hypothetical protein